MGAPLVNRSHQVNAYRERDILSADRGRLLVLTFDALVASMTRARAAMAASNSEPMSESLGKARLLLGELLATLDHKSGGSIADQLGSLYVFILSEIDDIAFHPDTTRLDRNLNLIRELRDAFAQIATARGPVS